MMTMQCIDLMRPAAARPAALKITNCLVSKSSHLGSARRTQSSARIMPRPQSRSLAMRAVANYGAEWATPQDAYLTVGLAHCFEQTDDGKLTARFIIEPISANALECMSNGGRTCFKLVYSLTLEEALSRDKTILPAEFEEFSFCENFAVRADSCARTWMRPHAMDNLISIVPLHQMSSGNFNYDITDKRVLNMENIVNDDDNVKQDISIDVYGRKEKEALKAEADGEAAAEEEEDELDSLLAA